MFCLHLKTSTNTEMPFHLKYAQTVLVMLMGFRMENVNCSSERPLNSSIASTSRYSFLQSTEIVPSNYNPLVPPLPSAGGPVNVEFSALITNIRDISEQSQEITLEMNLHIFWVDSRLMNLTAGKEFLVLNPSSLERYIWTPDIFIDHTKAINQPALMSKPASLRLYADGALRYSVRVSVTISCPMNFKYYPADVQRCLVDLKSYAFPNDILALGWQKESSLKLIDGLSLANFNLKMGEPEKFVLTTSSGSYSGIRFQIILDRKMSYHLLQTYIPSTMFIMVSWLTFILPQDSGAIMICTTTLLTVTTMFSSVRQSTPTVSYTKGIDIWMAVCMSYIFTALAQHIITNRLRHMKILLKPENPTEDHHPFREQNTDPPVGADPAVLSVSFRMKRDSFNMQNLNNARDSQNIEDTPNEVAMRYAKNQPNVPPPRVVETEDKEKISEYKLVGNKLRRLFSAVIPASFLLFNIIYWSWLLHASQ